MRTSSSRSQVGVRLAPDQLRLIDEVAQSIGCDRTAAARQCILIGAHLLRSGHGLNVNRALMSLEILVADCLRRARESDPKSVDALIDTAAKNVGDFHA
ncbi:hypothetical protein [Novosphingobium soli]|uniref:Ribbon-helix-helix protein, CopG family n=1 Tax=Novosphingobium soli TaxID=574956 RepID=A0ABV6CY45_9SPHN